MKNILSILSIFVILLCFLPYFNYAYATSGCCSWHGGVDYCDSSVGREVCNDGSYSPTCTCYKKPIVSTPIYSGVTKEQIVNLYRDLLERDPYNDDEINYWINSGKGIYTITTEFKNSEEYKKLHEGKTPTPTPTPTPSIKAEEIENDNYDWLWWIVPIGLVSLLIFICCSKKNKNE